MKFNQLPILKTKRLILRPVTMHDASDIFAYAQDPEVTQLLEWGPSKSIEETKIIIREWLSNYEQNKPAPWGIVDTESNKVIGTIGFHEYDKAQHTTVIGYCLSRDYWGEGIMLEALKSVIDYVFNETDIIQIVAFCRPDNPRSLRLLEKAGFQKHVKALKKRQFIKGQWVEFDQYVLHKS